MAEALARRDANESPGTSKEPGKKDIVGILLVAFTALNLGLLGGMGYLFYRLNHRIQHLESEQVKASQPVAREEGPELGKELQPQPIGVLVPMEAFLVNVNSDQGLKYLQVQLELELSEPLLEEEITRKKAAVRDAIILLLSTRTYKELREVNAIPKLRQDITKSVNRVLTTGKVKDAFLTQFHFN